MSWIRRALIDSIASRLGLAKPDLHRVPGLYKMHLAVSIQLIECGAWLPLHHLLRIWWCAFCIERSALHARRAEDCRR